MNETIKDMKGTKGRASEIDSKETDVVQRRIIMRIVREQKKKYGGESSIPNSSNEWNLGGRGRGMGNM
jgi:hypothetical protein